MIEPKCCMFLLIFNIDVLLKCDTNAKIHAVDDRLNIACYGFRLSATDSKERLHLFNNNKLKEIWKQELDVKIDEVGIHYCHAISWINTIKKQKNHKRTKDFHT